MGLYRSTMVEGGYIPPSLVSHAAQSRLSCGPASSHVAQPRLTWSSLVSWPSLVSHGGPASSLMAAQPRLMERSSLVSRSGPVSSRRAVQPRLEERSSLVLRNREEKEQERLSRETEKRRRRNPAHEAVVHSSFEN